MVWICQCTIACVFCSKENFPNYQLGLSFSSYLALSVPRCASSFQSVSKHLSHFSLLSLGCLNKLYSILLAKKQNFGVVQKYYNELQMVHILCCVVAERSGCNTAPHERRGECRQRIHWIQKHKLYSLTAVTRVNQSGRSESPK